MVQKLFNMGFHYPILISSKAYPDKLRFAKLCNGEFGGASLITSDGKSNSILTKLVFYPGV
jgi:hypothetical protein